MKVDSGNAITRVNEEVESVTMNKCEMLENLLTASISTVGAFIPILMLMVAHFLTRRHSYKKKREQLIILKDRQDKINEINEKTLKDICNANNVANYESLVRALTSYGTNPNTWKIIEFTKEQANALATGREKSLKLTTDILYIDNYGISTYFGRLLDNRFPDRT